MAGRRAGLIVQICALAIGLVLAATSSARAETPSPFDTWTAVVVAGDWRGAGGGPTQAFDNARRDIAAGLSDRGFDPGRIIQFSVRPESDIARKATAKAIYETLSAQSAQAPGCVVYFTSHGDPQGVVVDEVILPPHILGLMIDRSCGAKPTIVVVSACFSGVFVPALAKPNRMILTAARPDRTSFGCGEADTYPYFDDCFLKVLKGAAHFAVLAPEVRACVAAREIQEGVSPPSEPQIWIGPQLRPLLPLLAFTAPATP
ncbi:C13 family peptidase [Phenylobacterium sp.]|uniref:C13 family peptidase n=1 Tax=Phenylobacterium sp. TaxID=1871053 RepID=UPI002730FB22|nr:C13 family peptidase [Phenylobacterium sp.]MDP1616991.1 C13 family peptidase [Phenylobacterium sp.]MDP1987072.1 C13 family peptidase [Phenylobacterium sp.]